LGRPRRQAVLKNKLLATLAIAFVVPLGCGSNSSDDVLKNVNALVILQRTPRMGGIGDVFQYASYVPGGRLLKLAPPTADGQISELCCSQFGAEFVDMDIQSYDVSFDARSIVFSGHLAGGDRYGLFILTLDENGEAAGPPRQLNTDPTRDYVYPIFAAADRIVFVTNSVVEAGARQHRDEYERGETTQLGSIDIDGSDEILGPRNLSHRVAPTMLSDGHVLFTQWDHLGDENSGHLMMVNPDMTNLREVFGKEGSGITNSYLKAVELPPTEGTDEGLRVVVIGTSRDRTLQSGKLLDVKLGRTDSQGVWRQAEALTSVVDMTPQVPGDREPSQQTIGRYYDAFPVRADASKAWGDRPYYVVSWADGPVEEETLGAAGLMADFGVYLFESKSGQRRPIFNDANKWDIIPRPLMPRPAPENIASSIDMGSGSALIGSMNVYDSSLDSFEPDSIVAVRILEGFSTEEGVPDDFGLTEHEGAALIGEAPVYPDGSWAAYIPANVPIHLQPIDRFGMSQRNEPVWFSARAGESRFCGGCHEDRASTTIIEPGLTDAIAVGAEPFDKPRAERVSTTFTQTAVVGVPWGVVAGDPGVAALQPIFDAKCISCHEGTPGPANRSLTFTDEMGNTQTFTFDLRGQEVSYGVGEVMISGYSASHLSLLGPMMMELEEAGITVSGDMPIYVVPGEARQSLLFEKLNPMQLYPTADTGVRFRQGQAVHPADVGGTELTPDEYYLLILMADAGGQFYSRENAPGREY
jgi:hypothetical protein